MSILGRIHLVRHAEGLHNLRNDPTIPDASLSERGFDFAEELGRRFIREYSNSVGAVISSPLRRTIQTSLTAFSRILNSSQYPNSFGWGVKNGVMLSLDANLQEIADLPSNNGSIVNDLVDEFPGLEPEIQKLDGNWPRSPIPQSLSQRKDEILGRLQRDLADLQNGPRGNDIIVVTHQGVLAILAPSANIPVAHWQTFNLVRNADGQLLLR